MCEHRAAPLRKRFAFSELVLRRGCIKVERKSCGTPKKTLRVFRVRSMAAVHPLFANTMRHPLRKRFAFSEPVLRRRCIQLARISCGTPCALRQRCTGANRMQRAGALYGGIPMLYVSIIYYMIHQEKHRRIFPASRSGGTMGGARTRIFCARGGRRRPKRKTAEILFLRFCL